MFVFGVEVDGQWASIKESFTVPPLTFTDKITYFFTARGRLGVAAQNILFYGTGGYAHVGAKSEVTNGVATLSISGDRGGWTAGGGAEFGFGNASLKLEYLYIQTFDKDERRLWRAGHVERARPHGQRGIELSLRRRWAGRRTLLSSLDRVSPAGPQKASGLLRNRGSVQGEV